MANQKAQDHVCQQARKAFEAMDKDDSGMITICEFREYCGQIPNMEGLCKVFNEVDTSDDQKISVDELEELLRKVSKDKIEESHVIDLFKELDSSGDGYLNKEEFGALLVECGYGEACIQATCDQIAGPDGKICLQEFLSAWSHE